MNSFPTFLNSIEDQGLRSLDLETEYRSSKENAVRDFLSPCLNRSIRYRRAAGYFRSSVLNVIGREIAEFALRGGKLSLICSPELTHEDIDSIASGHAQRSILIQDKLKSEIEELFASEKTKFSLQLLSLLVSSGAIEIKIAMRSDAKGLYHEKIGIFEDNANNFVSFKGSANETWSGWHQHGNFESIEVFCSWGEEREALRVQKHLKHFDALWSQEDKDVEVFPFPADAQETLKKFALDETELHRFVSNIKQSQKRSPMEHQLNAITSWKENNYRGILQHATGSGKTFTAITAIKEHLNKNKPALVLVPSQLLLTQWVEEIHEEIPLATVLIAGGGNTRWKNKGKLQSFSKKDAGENKRVIVATMQTASSQNFRNSLVSGDHLMVVADEVHQIGSPRNSKFLAIEAGARLGLSATPERYGDPDGTKLLMDYFGPVLSPIITLQDAIKAGRLVQYEHFPYVVNLTAEETKEWAEITKLVKQEIARSNNSESPFFLTEKAKLLLIQRSRIAKKAAKKIEIAKQVIKENYSEGDAWLVYCEDSSQLEEVVSEFRASGIETIVYHSGMGGDRDATMSWFKEFGGVLVSIRCLDEGVDIPDVSHALILASSQNPRQFIQRRGRVLRKSPGKYIASIHDLIVVPVKDEDLDSQISLLKSELSRAIEFSENAVNRNASAQLRRISIEMGIDLSELSNMGLEEIDDDN